MEKATFAAGCFWHVEAIFRGARGVIHTSVGYMGGHYKNPTYEDVATDTTGHAEVAQVVYDPSLISYATLLSMLFKSHNPTSMAGVKHKYRSTVFYHTEEQKKTAEEALEVLAGRYDRPVRTTVTAASEYYPAEERHQHYYEKRGKP